MKIILMTILVCCFVALNHKELIYAQDSEASRAIISLLECEECTDGELEAVKRLGETAVPILVAYLRNGPSPPNLEKQKEHLIKRYEQVKAYGNSHALTFEISKKDYVRTYVENYKALYQIRSAQALSAIGGPDARRALREASQLPLREDVKTVVIKLLNIETPHIRRNLDPH